MMSSINNSSSIFSRAGKKLCWGSFSLPLRQIEEMVSRVCYFFVKHGKCKYGERCRHEHDKTLREMFTKNKQSGGGDNDEKEKNNEIPRRNNRPGKDKTDSSNNASCVANRDDVPTVPLPTQIFRQ